MNVFILKTILFHFVHLTRGTFKMEKDDGSFFEVRIPSFYLESKDEEKTIN
jgi:hypothetical protein